MGVMALQGITIADFGWIWAGPQLTKYLADMGAMAIKVESKRHPDNVRSLPPWPPPDHSPGLNRSGTLHANNRNKLGITLNLTKPKAVELAKRLIAVSDIMVENYSVGVMNRFGLGYEAVREVKPDIIYISMPAFGNTGPYRDYVAYGKTQSFISGLANSTGYPDQPPHDCGVSWGDVVAAAHGAVAVLSALHYRNVSGKGQFIDLSQWEALASLMPEAIMGYSLNRQVRSRQANRDDIMAPHNCYPCKGHMEWVAIAVATDQEWDGLCQALGQPEWCRDERFADAFRRWTHQDEIDRHIEAWTRTRSAYEVMEVLQAAGVAATPVLSNKGLDEDPHLGARDFVVEQDHPGVGRLRHTGLLWKMSKTPGQVYRHAPLLGEHNRYVFSELLGLPEDEMAALMEEEVIW